MLCKFCSPASKSEEPKFKSVERGDKSLDSEASKSGPKDSRKTTPNGNVWHKAKAEKKQLALVNTVITCKCHLLTFVLQ